MTTRSGNSRSEQTAGSAGATGVLSPRAFHARRAARDLAARESLRRRRLAEAEAAIRRRAPALPAVEAVYLFGSVLQAGKFAARSDVDVAVDCRDPQAESRLWRALEDDLRWPVDLRPRRGPVAMAVELSGKLVYERKIPGP